MPVSIGGGIDNVRVEAPLSTGILYSAQFHSHQETKMAPVELNYRHLKSHGKVGDCEQSKVSFKVRTSTY